MTTNDSTLTAEQPPPVSGQSVLTDLIHIRDHLLDLHDAHNFVGESVYELVKSDEAEPNSQGLSLILEHLRYRGRSLLDEVDALIDKQKSTDANHDID